MSPSEAVPQAPAAPGRQRRPVRRRFWLLLIATLGICLLLHPPTWHAALRTWLAWQARRHGCDLTVAAMDGGLFDTTQLYGVRCRRRGSPPPEGETGTDLFIARADLTLSWRLPFFQRAAPSRVRGIVLEGVRGRWDLRDLSGPRRSAPTLSAANAARGGLSLAAIPGDVFARALGTLFPSLGRYSARLVPETFLVRADDLLLVRGRYRLRALHLSLSGARDDTGRCAAHEVQIAGPGFENTLLSPHCRTYWKGSRLTLAQLDLAPGVSLARATLDGTHLDHRTLDWDGRLTALGGELRGQGAVDFSGERLALEVAASLRGTALRPLARLLGVAGPADGLIDQGNFTFRGDPENWSGAQMWLAAHATDFRWGKRRWQDLELQAVIVDRRVQVHRLELRQSRNSLSIQGECPLPPPAPASEDHPPAADALRQWREGGFSCQVDARLEDLRSLADLFGPQAPELDGRMSVNGSLGAPPGPGQEINGYLNVEGTRLVLRGAPLDYLRSTLLFRAGEVRMADLQATHGSDYFTGSGSLRLDGPPRYTGDLRAEIRQLAAYTPALAGLPLVDELARVGGLSALLRWDDSVLHFDEFKGQFDGSPCTVGGTVDLHDLEHPALDLSIDGENVALRAADGKSQMQADCALTVRSVAGGVPTLGGDIRVLGGSLDAGLEVVPAPAAAGDFLSYWQWLPEDLRRCALDCNVTAAAPLRLAEGGELTPELHICPAPMPGLNGQSDFGKLEIANARMQTPTGELRGVRGIIYFPFGINGPVSTSLLANGPDGARIALYGGWNLVETAVIGGESLARAPVDVATDDWSTLHPAALPLLWQADKTPWLDLTAVQPLPPVPSPPRVQVQLR